MQVHFQWPPVKPSLYKCRTWNILYIFTGGHQVAAKQFNLNRKLFQAELVHMPNRTEYLIVIAQRANRVYKSTCNPEIKWYKRAVTQRGEQNIYEQLHTKQSSIHSRPYSPITAEYIKCSYLPNSEEHIQ